MRVFALALLLASPAFAEDCAIYDAPLAYNACLARQGPGARAAHVRSGPQARQKVVRHSGRGEMVFSVGK